MASFACDQTEWMMNLDAAAGMDLPSLNDLLRQYYTSAESTAPGNNPFDNTQSKTLPNIGKVLLKWKLNVAPVLAFGPPSQAVWDAALDSAGHTNAQDKKPLPSGPMVQLTMPDLSASYTLDAQPSMGGESKNVIAYATLAFPPGEIDIQLVALTINESSFSTWDKVIFNTFLVPEIFKAAQQMMSVIHLPTLSWKGVTLNPVQISLQGSRLLAAATLTTNKAPLDTSGAVWPTDPIFVIASQSLINAALAAGIAPYQNYPFKDSGNFKSLADWDYSGQVTSLTATVKTVQPLTIDAELSVSLSAGAKLTAAGMALAAVGCALGAGLLFL
jgi:hypothetical protein